MTAPPAGRGTALVLASLLTAMIAPVEGFLFAFFVLGPLHYFTELAWLGERGFFVESDAGRRLLAGIAIAGSGLAVATGAEPLRAWAADLQVLAVTAMFTAVVVAGHLVIAPPQPRRRLGMVLAASIVIGVMLGRSSSGERYFLLFGLLLPSIVHVLGFTTLFMLHGVVTRRRREDVVTFAAFVAGLVLVLTLEGPAPAGPLALHRTVIGYLQDTLVAFGLSAPTALRLLAFAYLHHFLNWFDKTERVGWTRLPRSRLLAIGGLWLACVAAYTVDVELGLLVVLLPNVAHVVLELPLNWRTFAPGIAGAYRSARGGA